MGTHAISILDDEAIAALYRVHGAVLKRCCRRVLGDAGAAEDATHEVFVRVHRHFAQGAREDLPPDDEMLPWLRRIATNYCLNEIRNRKLRIPKETIGDEAGCDPEPSIAARNVARRLLGALPDHLRDLVWLTYVDDLKQDETAKVLGVSRRTIVNRMRELRACIDTLAATM